MLRAKRGCVCEIVIHVLAIGAGFAMEIATEWSLDNSTSPQCVIRAVKQTSRIMPKMGHLQYQVLMFNAVFIISYADIGECFVLFLDVIDGIISAFEQDGKNVVTKEVTVFITDSANLPPVFSGPTTIYVAENIQAVSII